jgi:hypothetical protein
MTDYKTKYENERSTRKLLEKENELLKKEIELLKIEMKQQNRNTYSKDGVKKCETSDSEKSSSDSSSEKEEPPIFTRLIRKKKNAQQLKSIRDLIQDEINKMTVAEIDNYGTSMLETGDYEILFLENILQKINIENRPIILIETGFRVYDYVKDKDCNEWTEVSMMKLISKTFERINNMMIKRFNLLTNNCDVNHVDETEQVYRLTVFNQLCSIEDNKLLKRRSRSLDKLKKYFVQDD